jgi:hypothetical protein
MKPSTIGGINLLPEEDKRALYARYIPASLLERFALPPVDSPEIQVFLQFKFAAGASSMEMSLFHQPGFPDPVLYTHVSDTMNGQIHVLLYILNDPDSPRFDVDRMPDGRSTTFGTQDRNLEAECAALQAGLAPGQVRHGLRMLGTAIETFEGFVTLLGQQMYFVEPLYYHNAVIFERYGFAYQQGRRLMDQLNAGFLPGSHLATALVEQNPFRQPAATTSVRLRSWAIHDGITGAPFTNVTMYKRIGQLAKIDTAPGIKW